MRILWSREPIAANEERLEVEPVARLRRNQPWVVEVETADSDGVVEQDAITGCIDDAGRHLPVFAESMTSGEIEGGVDGEIAAVLWPLVGTAQAVREA